MGFCLQCKKWVTQPEGKRTKKFCNATCRSNYRYAKNKKEKDQELGGKMKFVTPTPAAYDGVKLSRMTHDEPAMWATPKQQVSLPKTPAQWMKEKREIENQEDYQKWLTALDEDPFLGKKQKDIIKSTNPSEL